MRPSGIRIGLVLLVGILAASTASILVRLALEAAGTRAVGFSLLMSALRLLFASLVLLPGFRPPRAKQALLPAALAGVFLALHFALWITSLSFTSIAASTALVTTNPIWITLFSWFFLKETPTPLTLLGVGFALAGGFLIALGDGEKGGANPALGNLLALLGAMSVSAYFLLGREAQRRGLSILEYIRLAYPVAALVLLPLPPLFGTPYLGHPPMAYLWILLMALIPQLVGHTSFNWATRYVPPVLVTLVILLEPVGASLLGFLLFGEYPGLRVFLGAGVLLTGVALAVLGERR
ncbi:MAG: EamA family transporter [Thermus sp.]|uniref:DMT family transporter n=1 Tax=Thermus sp. TaxID=275 RepID=UPI0033244C16